MLWNLLSIFASIYVGHGCSSCVQLLRYSSAICFNALFLMFLFIARVNSYFALCAVTKDAREQLAPAADRMSRLPICWANCGSEWAQLGQRGRRRLGASCAGITDGRDREIAHHKVSFIFTADVTNRTAPDWRLRPKHADVTSAWSWRVCGITPAIRC